MTEVLIVVPWRPAAEDRIAIWERLKPWWAQSGYPIVEADSGDEPFNRGRSQNLGAAAGSWDVLAVLDADCVVKREFFEEGIDLAHRTGGLVLPHMRYCPLKSDAQTRRWLAQEDLSVPPGGAIIQQYGAKGGLHLISREAWDVIQYDGETRHRGQDSRLIAAAKAVGIPFNRTFGTLIHGFHHRTDVTDPAQRPDPNRRWQAQPVKLW